MEKLKLSTRLQAIADFVPYGANVADIGTDHGYIPVWLAQNQITDRLVAADINKGPLEHARQTAKTYNVEDNIRFELCSGLSFNGSSEYNTIIIAGMGGELIASIIEAAPWTKREDVTFILQPNSRIQVLVEYLLSNNYQLQNARLVKDAGKLYQILIVSFGNGAPIENEARRLVNPFYFTNKDPLLGEYLDTLIRQYEAAEKGMRSGKHDEATLLRTSQMISELKAMKEEAAV